MDNINVGDIIVVSCSGVQTYHKMVSKNPDGGGEFITVLRDGSPHPRILEVSTMTYEELTNPDGYSVSHYIPY